MPEDVNFQDHIQERNPLGGVIGSLCDCDERLPKQYMPNGSHKWTGKKELIQVSLLIVNYKVIALIILQ